MATDVLDKTQPCTAPYSHPLESTQPSCAADDSERLRPRSQRSIRSSGSSGASHLSHRRPQPVMDEATPIRQAASDSNRHYNTGGSSQAAPDSASGTGAASAAKPLDQPAQTVQDGNVSNDQKVGWFKRTVERYGSISLENKGSVARDHLALERTFLAWLRTSLAFASIGIAITQLFRLNTSIAHRSRALDLAPAPSATGIPFSPFLGHSIPVELAPYLQRLDAASGVKSMPAVGPTLFDQLFMLDSEGKKIDQDPIGVWSRQANIKSVGTMQSDSKIRHLGKPLGATFIGISILILVVGFHRYFESQYWVIRGKFPASRASIAFVGFITGALIIASLVVVVVVDPTRYERK